MRHSKGRSLARVYRDALGFPHIYSRDSAAALYAHGLVQMEDAPASVLLSFAKARAELHLRVGSAGTFEQDVRTLRWAHPHHGRRLWRESSPRLRKWVQAFTAGLIDYRRVHKATLHERLCDGRACLSPDQARALLAMPLKPWDVLALDHHLASMGEIERLEGVVRAPTSSNAIAVEATMSSTGHAMILIDPHIPLEAMAELRLMLVHVEAPGLQAAGLVRPGSPLPFAGCLGRTALALVANWPTTGWLLRVPRRGSRIRLEGSWRSIKERTVRGPGSVRRVLRWVGAARHPVLGLSARWAEVAVIASARAGALTAQSDALIRSRASTQKALLDALDVPGHPSLSFVAAGRDGRIASVWNALVPKSVWNAGAALEAPPRVDGRRPTGVLEPVASAARLPRSIGRTNGVIVNNNASWDLQEAPTSNGFGAWPPSVAGASDSLSSYRHQRSWELLVENRRWTPTLLESLAIDDKEPRALGWRDLVRTVPVDGLGGEALRLLRRWSGRSSKGSRLATLAELWLEAMRRYFGVAFDNFDRPELMPQSLSPHQRTGAIACLVEAFEQWQRMGRPTWGEVHGMLTHTRRGPVWHGLPGTLHANRAMGGNPLGVEGASSHVVHGQSCAMVISMSKRARIRFMKAFANREDPVGDDVVARRWRAGTFSDFEVSQKPLNVWGEPVFQIRRRTPGE